MSRTQYRAICSACGREQAVLGDAIADHGYTLDYHWRNGTCDGARRAHFGTPAGRDYRAEYVGRLRDQANRRSLLADAVAKGEAVARSYSRHTKQMVDITDQYAIRVHVDNLRFEAGQIRREAERLQVSINEWRPMSSRPVTVEKKQTIIHYHRERWGKFCAASAMGARKGVTTGQWEHVTCPKCIARREYFAKQGRSA
jgi:hypothetical protein